MSDRVSLTVDAYETIFADYGILIISYLVKAGSKHQDITSCDVLYQCYEAGRILMTGN
ncbi:MAG: hypothetical protein O4861_22980 [Trichodesmium sp. St16_bin4-tuft]|nr:hypothetical protein [Trichodesmium sp. MAG_R01]MDE5072303.1 hypothetical protein [Trichodesmium sp. St5_bin8]MDE5091679.1 hypothetical protein [Trichodesmium sp. St18_bin3_1_1]MDE5101036.1 hypothetical protein [Trichodesmium sp. St16_bin4-tuft]MDE5102603.1 hypothetical protein [Trichodesmium sp. St19_bin2]